MDMVKHEIIVNIKTLYFIKIYIGMIKACLMNWIHIIFSVFSNGSIMTMIKHGSATMLDHVIFVDRSRSNTFSFYQDFSWLESWKVDYPIHDQWTWLNMFSCDHGICCNLGQNMFDCVSKTCLTIFKHVWSCFDRLHTGSYVFFCCSGRSVNPIETKMIICTLKVYFSDFLSVLFKNYYLQRGIIYTCSWH